MYPLIQRLNEAADIVLKHSEQCLDKQQIIDVMQDFRPYGKKAVTNDFVNFYCENAANDDFDSTAA